MALLPKLAAGTTLSEQAYEAIRSAIISGDLRWGEKVTERGLAESLSISATPVREALRRLEQDRLVERLGPRSVRIVEFDDEELREITMIEDSLRALSARLAAAKATPRQIAEMESKLDEASILVDELERSDLAGASLVKKLDRIRVLTRAFHDLIDTAGGNPTLRHMQNMVDAFGGNERRKSVSADLERDPASLKKRFQAHRAILEAVASGDGEEAHRLVLDHSQVSNGALLRNRHTS